MHTQTIGTRAQVWHGTARKTSGGLTKAHLMQNKAGRIVSRAKHNTAKREMRLVKHGYGTKKGEFGFVKLGSHKRSHKKKKMRGGKSLSYSSFKGGAGVGSWSPADINSDYMIKDVVPQQFGPLERALVGGRSRGRSQGRGKSRQQRGGYFGNAFSPGDAMGQGIAGQGASAPAPVAPQEPAKQAGGRHRRGKKHRRGMMGGTGSRGYAPSELSAPEMRALNA
jgi:hypothetical protein